MDSGGLKKLLVVVVIAVLALPFLPKLLPKPLTFDQMKTGFAAAGLNVEQFQETSPTLESTAEASATINGATINIYQYGDEGKIVKNLEYQKNDPGSAMVEAWGLAQSLGAAPNRNKPRRSGRNGLFMIVAIGDDKEMLKRIVDAFEDL